MMLRSNILSNIQVIGLVVMNITFMCGGLSKAQSRATFVGFDTKTQGNWKGTYGKEGFAVVADTTSYPAYAYAAIADSNARSYRWSYSTSDIRALQKASDESRIAAAWYSSTSFSVDLALSDQSPHQIALYCLDWDALGRSQIVDIQNGDTNEVLDSRAISAFRGGVYLVWEITGHVKLRVTDSSPELSTVVSGLFFDSTAGSSSAPPPSNKKNCQITKQSGSLPAFTASCTGGSGNSQLVYRNTDGSVSAQLYGMDGIICIAYINGKNSPTLVPLVGTAITVPATSVAFQCLGPNGTQTSDTINWP